MKQQIFASYVPSSYPIKMEVSHLSYRSAQSGPTTPDSQQHTFNKALLFNNAPQEHFNVPISRETEGPLGTWLMDVPASASPRSSRMSETPSQGIATPASDVFYSPPYPEQLPLYAYELLEQPQPHRSCSTSHPDWVDNAGNWQRNHSESGLWSTQSFVAQPWNPNSYSGNDPLNVNHTHTSDAILEPFGYPLQDHFPTTEVIQMDSVMSVDEDLLEDDDTTGEDEDLSENDSDDSDDSQDQSSLSRSGVTPNLGIARIQVDRWTIPVNDIQQSDTRMYVCNVLDCHTPFQRPEHLRRHVRSKHTDLKPFICKITQCSKPFSRSDNLGDHYWTHLDRGGRAGVNKKMTLSQLKFILTGQSGRKIFRKLRLKLQKHEEKERQKRSHGTLPARMERARL